MEVYTVYVKFIFSRVFFCLVLDGELAEAWEDRGVSVGVCPGRTQFLKDPDLPGTQLPEDSGRCSVASRHSLYTLDMQHSQSRGWWRPKPLLLREASHLYSSRRTALGGVLS